jgi:hypothetical protein
MRNADKTMYVVEVAYFKGASRYFVFDTRADARDFAKVKRKSDKVFSTDIMRAARGPSNVKR